MNENETLVIDGPDRITIKAFIEPPPHHDPLRRTVRVLVTRIHKGQKVFGQTLDKHGRWVDLVEGTLMHPDHGLTLPEGLDSVEIGRRFRDWLALIDARGPVGKFIWTWVHDEIDIVRKQERAINPSNVQVLVSLQTALHQLGIDPETVP